jgi:chromate transporter
LLLATLAINLPHCLATFWVGRAVARVADRPWLRLSKDALVPVTVGLILASGVVMARAADHGMLTVAISMGTAAFIACTGRNPLWMLGAGTLISLIGIRLGLPT